MAEKYPLTEKKYPLREPTYKRWQHTLSGWLFLVKTPCSEEGAKAESQICARMWEDNEFNCKIRAEFEEWLAQEPDMPFVKAKRDEWAEMSEDKLRRSMRKSVRNQSKYKGRGKEKRREP